MLSRREFTKGAAVGAVGASVVSLEGCGASTWIDMVLADLPTILSIITSILGIVMGGGVPAALVSEIQNIANQVTTALQTAKTLIAQYQAAPNATLLAKIDAALVDAQSNLGAILNIFHVSDPVLQATISASVGLAITVVLGIEALIPVPPAASDARKALQTHGGSEAIKQAYNFILSGKYPNAVLR
jgi:hypothetical protein